MINSLKFIRNFFIKYKFISVIIFFILILTQAFHSFETTTDFNILLILFLWLFNIWFSKIEADISILIGLALLFISSFFLAGGFKNIAQGFADWAFFLLLFGICQQFLILSFKVKRSIKKNLKN